MKWSNKKQNNYWLKVKDKYNKDKRIKYKTDNNYRLQELKRRLNYYYDKRDKLELSHLRIRFELLKKYNFTCVYCGRKSPEVILEIDHIIPRSKSGSNKIENLTVACRDCNLGKSDLTL